MASGTYGFGPKGAIALTECFEKLQPERDCFVWCGWQDAIALLGFADLRPLVEESYRRGAVSPEYTEFEFFEEDLKRAIECPGALPCGRPSDDYELFGDTVEELSDWYGFSERYLQDRERSARAADSHRTFGQWGAPAINPYRDVGRNDPCPCGSGKKFKKCCLDHVAAGGLEAA